MTDVVEASDVEALDASGPNPTDTGTDAPLADASGVVPPACSSCLEMHCASAYTACLADPSCYGLVLCTDTCIEDGGNAEACGLGCFADSDSGRAQGQAEVLVQCADISCAATCF
jgi:hypothetical protein